MSLGVILSNFKEISLSNASVISRGILQLLEPFRNVRSFYNIIITTAATTVTSTAAATTILIIKHSIK